MNWWSRCSDRMPEEGKEVLITVERTRHCFLVDGWVAIDRFINGEQEGGPYVLSPTHWMPLPKPPHA